MPLTNPRWGDAVAAAVLAVGVDDSAEVTVAQLEAVWNAVCGEHITEITGNAITTSNGVTAAHAPGGPAPIVGLPGTIT